MTACDGRQQALRIGRCDVNLPGGDCLKRQRATSKLNKVDDIDAVVTEKSTFVSDMQEDVVNGRAV